MGTLYILFALQAAQVQQLNQLNERILELTTNVQNFIEHHKAETGA